MHEVVKEEVGQTGNKVSAISNNQHLNSGDVLIVPGDLFSFFLRTIPGPKTGASEVRISSNGPSGQ